VDHQVALAIQQTELDFTKLAKTMHRHAHARTPPTQAGSTATRATTSEGGHRGATSGDGHSDEKAADESGALLAHVANSNFFGKDLVATLQELHDTQIQHEEDAARNMHKSAAPTMAVPRNAFEAGIFANGGGERDMVWERTQYAGRSNYKCLPLTPATSQTAPRAATGAAGLDTVHPPSDLSSVAPDHRTVGRAS
jgi:hypothetical protein